MNENRNSIHHQSMVRDQTFKEHPIKNHETENYSDYDVTAKYYDSADFTFDGSFSMLIYCKALLSKFSELTNSQIPKFIDYQISFVSDKKQWLYDIEKLIENNPERINRIRPELHDYLTKLIQAKIASMDASLVPGPPKQLTWKGPEIDLIELITALTQSKRIVNEKGESIRTEAIEFFESVFHIKLKDPEKKLSQTKGRKEGYNHFLDRLSEKFKEWEQKRSK